MFSLKEDLFTAYYCARNNKRRTTNSLQFEIKYESNLLKLHKQLENGSYRLQPSICFIIHDSVQREIFAASFRDRVVHHLVYNYISQIFERTFIHDAYSCRLGKGTLYGIRRLEHFVRSCSRNYKKDCYILKMDIQGYFMSIDKALLFEMLQNTLRKRENELQCSLPWLMKLLHQIVFADPTEGCIVRGDKADWHGLPRTKSLFASMPGKGLPIGNLTSQLFSNVYLNQLDHWIKRDLKIRYYGRYVDDLVLVHHDKEYLKASLSGIKQFLANELMMDLNPKKTYLQHYSHGARFLGAYILPYRTYISKRTKSGFIHAVSRQTDQLIHEPEQIDIPGTVSQMNSYLGLLQQHNTFNLRRNWTKGIILASDGLLKVNSDYSVLKKTR